MDVVLRRRESTPLASGSARGVAARYRGRIGVRSSSRTLSSPGKQKSPSSRADSVKERFEQMSSVRSAEFRQSEEIKELRRKLQLAESQSAHLAVRGAQATDERALAIRAKTEYEAANARARTV
jgi:hypothetical protein